jgi:STE24 endopeptidase
MNTSSIMTSAFALALLSSLAIKYWLLTRQNQHVSLHRPSVPTAFASVISLPDHQKAADYTLAKSKVALWDLALETFLLLAWTLLGGLNALNQMLLQVLGPGLWQEVCVILCFMAMGALINLPLSWYQTFVIESKFGFNNSTLKLWLVDLLKATLLGAVIGIPLISVILWVMQSGGFYWWIWAWAILVGFQLLMIWIAPNYLMPLFNKFTPLEDESLKARISQLMDRSGFKAKGFFVMDGSKRSAHSNAFFTGIGSSKRVVFFDTLLKQLSADEMEAVLAHELGHFKHKHIVKMMAINFLTTLLGFAALGWIMQQTWFYTGLGVTPNLGLGDAPHNNALALLLFTLVVPLVSFLLSPISSARSRSQEFEADAYAMQQANANALKSALLKLYQDNASTLTPDPWFVRFYYSHPPASERLSRMGS